MTKIQKSLAAVLAVFIVSTASATTIDQERVTVDLETGKVKVKMEVEELTTDSFNYQTGHEVKNLKANFEGERAECQVEKLAIGADINCKTDLKRNFTASLTYKTDNLVQTQGSIRKFVYTQSIYRPVKNYSFRVILPEGTGLVDKSNVTTPVIQPEGGKLGSQNGRRFYVEWNISPGLEEIRFQVLYEKFDKDTSKSLLPAAAALITVIVISIIVYNRKKKSGSKKMIEKLGTDEKMVVDYLKESGGSMLQKDIVEKSDYSKAKISGVVKDLEEKEIIEKEKEGRSNKVTLNKEFID